MDDSPLYTYEPHPTAHDPININEAHRAEHNYNHYIAKAFMALLTAMPLFWVVLIGCTAWFIMNGLGIWSFDAPPFQLLSTVVSVMELPLMLIITIGQEWDFRHQELVAEELYNASVKSEHNIMQVMQHLSAQDALIQQTANRIETIERIETTEVLKISDMLESIVTKLDAHETLLKALSAPRTRKSVTHD